MCYCIYFECSAVGGEVADVVSRQEEHTAAVLGALEQNLVQLEQERTEGLQQTPVAIALHSHTILQDKVKPGSSRQRELVVHYTDILYVFIGAYTRKW